MSSLVESSDFSEEGTAMVEGDDEPEEGEVSDDDDDEEEEEKELKEIDLKNFDLFDNRSVGSSDKENLDHSQNGKVACDDDLIQWKRYKEEGRESVLKEKECGRVASNNWEGRQNQNWEERRQNNRDRHHDSWHEKKQGERQKSRKETERR